MNCKNCGSNNIRLEKAYNYQFDEDDEIKIIDCKICNICGCIHGIIDNISFFEYTKHINSFEKLSNVGEWKI